MTVDADTNICDTALHWAADRGLGAVVSTLVLAGRRTKIHMAMQWKHLSYGQSKLAV